MENEKIKIDNKTEKPSNLRTYMTDMADAVRENEMSVIKIALAEQRNRERGDYYRQIEGTPKKKILWAVGGILIISVSIFLAYFIIKKAEEKNSPPIITQVETPISVDSQAVVNLTNIINKIEASDLINAELNKEQNGLIKALFLKKQEDSYFRDLSLEELFSILRHTAPSSLIRSFSDNYLLGSYVSQNQTEKKSLFLIIKIKDYGLAYAGMLEWEKTILSDFFSLFKINVSGENRNLLEKSFKDFIIQNKDTRILYTEDGTDVLFYLFPDKDTLVITSDQEAIKEIISRLLIRQAKPL